MKDAHHIEISSSPPADEVLRLEVNGNVFVRGQLVGNHPELHAFVISFARGNVEARDVAAMPVEMYAGPRSELIFKIDQQPWVTFYHAHTEIRGVRDDDPTRAFHVLVEWMHAIQARASKQ